MTTNIRMLKLPSSTAKQNEGTNRRKLEAMLGMQLMLQFQKLLRRLRLSA
ncbi:MAG TPA: hypothetical protein ACQGQN_05895 [Xylella fastidiosa subsp. fastidiosa]|jgi:hypothetical protein